jgi:hypothetical protein
LTAVAGELELEQQLDRSVTVEELEAVMLADAEL